MIRFLKKIGRPFWFGNPRLVPALLLVCSIHAPAALSLTLDGKVYGDGVVLDQATIELRSSDNTLLATDITDVTGAYSFTVEANTTYKIDITPPPGSPFTAATGNTVSISGVNLTKDFFLFSGQVSLLSGAIRLSTGEALTNGAEFSIQSQSGGSSYSVNSVGSYSVSVANDSYKLTGLYVAYPFYINGVQYSRISAMGSRPSSWDVGPFTVSGDTTQDYVMPEYVEVAGNVVDSNGVGIANIRVSGGSQYGSVDPVTTGADGSFRFFIVAGSGGYIYADAPQGSGWEDTRVSDLDFTTSQTSISVTPAKLPLLTGAIRLSTGEALTNGAEFSIQSQSGGSSYSVNSVGSYSVSVANDSYKLTGLYVAYPFYINGVQYSRISAMGSRPSSWDVGPFTVSGDTTQDYVMPEYVEVAGNVVDSNGVGMANIRVSGATDYGSVDPITTASDGAFRFFVVAGSGGRLNVDAPLNSGILDQSVSGLNFEQSYTASLVMPVTDTAPPTFLISPTQLSASQNAVTLAWQTDEPTRSVVTGTGFASVSNSDYRVNHEVTLTGLSPSTSYTATVAITDRSGNGPVEATVTYTTPAAPDTAPPVITVNPVIASITDNSMVVQWSTNEPALTALKWGASNLSNTTQPDAVYRTEHEIRLTGLTGLTDYQVRASATDIEGNGPTVSPIVAVKTLTAPDTTAPAISAGPFISNVTDTEAMVSWVTNEPAVSGVSLNDGTAYVVYRDEALVTEHAVRLTGLSSSTTYYYTVSSTDEAGNGPTLSTGDSFITQVTADTSPPSLVEATKVVGVTNQSAVLHFQTDEPSSVTLSYGVVQNQLDQTVSVAKLGKRHVIQLSDLDSDQTYYFSARLTDSSANSAAQPADSFKTRPSVPISAPTYVAEPTVLVSGDGRALIRWDTSEATQCSVTFGISGSSEERRLDIAGKRTSHQAMLTELLPGRLYSFSLTCRNVAGVAATYNSSGDGFGLTPSSATEWLFAVVNNFFFNQAFAQTTGSFSFSEQVDSAGPVLLDSEFLHRNAENIVVRLRFDEPATVETRYGMSQLNKSASSENFKLEHVIVLAGLVANQRYTIEFRARDISGNASTTVKSSESSGSQLDESAPTLIGSPEFNQESATGASVYFLTDEYAASSLSCARVDTGATFTQGIEGLGKSHPISLQDIDPDTNYDCVVQAVDTSNNKLTSASYRLVMGNAPAVTYTVTPSSDLNGSIYPSSPQTVAENGSKSFTLTPNNGYIIDSVAGTCIGSLSGSVYTVSSVTADCTVEAAFEAEPVVLHVVTPSAGGNGAIAPSSPISVLNLNSVNFTVTPDSGYEIAAVAGTCGGSLSGNTYTTNAITAACTVEASFTQNTYSVTPSAGDGGAISPSTLQTIAEGATTTFTVTPDSGYKIAAVGGTCGGLLSGNTYTTNAITAACTVDASFVRNEVIELSDDVELELTFDVDSAITLVPGSVSVSDVAQPPSGIQNAIGKQISFSLTGVDPSESVSVSVDFGEELPENARAYKVMGDTWLEISSAVISETSISYEITDNGAYDSNDTPGVIDDPVTVAVPAPSIPTSVPMWKAHHLWLLVGAVLSLGLLLLARGFGLNAYRRA